MITAEKKAEKVAFALHHREADMLVSGTYVDKVGRGFRGCSVGCDAISIALSRKENPLDVRGSSHSYVADYFGTPEWLEYLRDSVFEGLPSADRIQWHVDLAEALPVGVDFNPIRHAIQRDILREVALPACGEGDEKWRADCRAAVEAVAALHDRSITDKEYSKAFYFWEAAEAAWAASAAEAARAAWAAEAAAWKKIAEITLRHLRAASDKGADQ